MNHYLHLLLLLFYSFGCSFMASAQQEDWRKFIEQMAEDEMNESAIDNLYEELLYLENNPMNLNTVTRDQLERLPLLSREEADAIFHFLEKNRPLHTVFELRNVPQLNLKKIQLILPFFYTEQKEEESITLKPSGIVKQGRHEIQFRLDKTLNQRAGYNEYPDSILEKYPNRKYAGEDFYTSLRYSLRYKKRVTAGFTAEKDAGEPFMKSGHRKGYDHYGFHLIIHDTGIFKTIALGDYRLSFGQGLVLNNDFMVNKSWSTGNIARRTQQPKRHFSTAEQGFFRGAAATAQAGSFSLTGFYSNKMIDANLSTKGDITSFKTDGLHRTPLEMEKKRNTREEVTGANINFRHKRLQIGLSGIYYKYNRMHNPTPRDYNRYYLKGQSNFNAGIDYSYQLPGMIFAGETAIAKNGAVAALHSLQYRHSNNLSFSLLHRYYPISYNALYAQSFSEGSRVQNEQGLYAGAICNPIANLSVTAYIDFARFPWLKYGVDSPSNAMDLYLLINYSLTDRSYLEIRYKHKRKEKNEAWPDSKSRTVLPYHTQKLRLRYSHEFYDGWTMRTTLDCAHYKAEHFIPEMGYMLSQNISYRGKNALRGDAYLAWFDSDSYNARLYSYERNLLNSFYMPSFYGKGLRIAFSAKYAISKNITLSVKMGHTHYLNRETIGSGTERIDGNSRTDIYTYIRWQF